MNCEPLRIEIPMRPETGPVNAYLFTDPEVVLVDTGPASPAAWEALTAGLASHGVSAADIQRVIVSHPHHDHFAQAGRLVQEGAAQVWIAEVGAPALLDRERVLAAMGRDKKRASGKARFVLPVRIGEVRWGIEVDDLNLLPFDSW